MCFATFVLMTNYFSVLNSIISQLQDALKQMSVVFSWMTANLLTFNSSKKTETEFSLD